MAPRRTKTSRPAKKRVPSKQSRPPCKIRYIEPPGMDLQVYLCIVQWLEHWKPRAIPTLAAKVAVMEDRLHYLVKKMVVESFGSATVERPCTWEDPTMGCTTSGNVMSKSSSAMEEP